MREPSRSHAAASADLTRIAAQVDEEALLDADTLGKAEKLAASIRLSHVRNVFAADHEGWFPAFPSDVALVSLRSADQLLRQRTPFQLKVVDSTEAASEVGRALDGPDEWDGRGWTEESAARGLTVLAALIRGTRQFGGMASFSREVVVGGDKDGSLDIDYRYRGEYVYVVPKARGRRLSSALRWAISEVFANDFEVMRTAMEQSVLSGAGMPALNFSVHSEAHSTEGLRFLDALSGDMQAVAEETFGFEGEWPLVNTRVLEDYGP